MRQQRLGPEFGMELAGQEPGVIGKLDDLYEAPIGGLAGDPQTPFDQVLGQGTVHLVPVPVPFGNLQDAEGFMREGAGFQKAGVPTQTHVSPHAIHSFQLLQLVDDLLGGSGIELAAVGVAHSTDVSSKLDDGALEAQTDAKEGVFLLPSELDGVDHAGHAPNAEPSGHQDAVHAGKLLAQCLILHPLSLDPVNVDAGLVGEPTVGQSLGETLVGIFVFYILAHERDIDGGGGILKGFHRPDPVLHVLVSVGKIQVLEDDGIQTLLCQKQGHLINGFHILGSDHRLFGHVAKKSDLLPDFLGENPVGPAQENIGLNANRSQFPYRVLGRLGFELSHGSDEGYQGQVYENGVAPTHLEAELSDGLEKGKRLDVSYRSTNLDDLNVHTLGNL